MKTRDHIEIVEAAYALDLSDDAWQRRLAELVSRQWGGGVLSFTFDASEPEQFASKNFVMTGAEVDPADLDALKAVKIPAEHVRAQYLRGPHLKYIFDALGPAIYEAEWARASFEICSDLKDYALTLNALDPSGLGLGFGLFSSTNEPLSRGTQELWAQLATHVSIGGRLRRALSRASPRPQPDRGEAVVDLDGRCQHAEGEARTRESREVLREAARRMMRARSSLRRRDEEEALEIWRGLVSGRWSLVDRFESDGKHYLVAHRNPPEVRDRRALTARESQVASYLAMGLSNKLIGYSLGLSTSVVSDHVASIARKLNVRSRVELVHLLGALHAEREEA